MLRSLVGSEMCIRDRITGSPKVAAYSMALLITEESSTLLPSSVTATMPAAFMSPISDKSAPFSPLVMAPAGSTRITAVCLAFSTMYRVTEGLSFTGSVFGMHTTVVTPPEAVSYTHLTLPTIYSV